jgi:hypothetical protein
VKTKVLSILLSLAVIMGLSGLFSTTVSAAVDPAFAYGMVFAATNAHPGNAVVMYNRHADGKLSLVGSFYTKGDGINETSPDPLGSQGSLLLTPDGKWLLAVNGGSNNITIFHVKQNGLDFVGKVSSGGIMPVSLTIFGNEVFVLNDGDSTHLGNITGFNLGNRGDLDPVWGSTRWLPAGGVQDFGQVGFDKSGHWLVVTDKAGEIIVYPVGWNQMPAKNPIITPSTSTTPFSFFFDNNDNLLVVSVNGGNGAVSSYAIDHDGTLDAINTVYNGQNASCWIAGNEMGAVFTTNPGSTSISAFMDKSYSGKVSLVKATAVTGIATIDEGITNDGHFLYTLGPGVGIYGFKIGYGGTLTSLGSAFGTVEFSGNAFAQGIAVK